MTGFIAVHVGAGSHSEYLTPSYQKTCKEACNAALVLLREGCNSTQAIAAAVSVLEDCPLTNAGIGSNLTLKRTIECDAGIMEGSGLNFGSVGALCNIKNPVQVAKRILDDQNKGLSCGRVPPCTLVGTGAFDWATSNGFKYFSQSELVTKSAERQYSKSIDLVMQKEASEAKNITNKARVMSRSTQRQNIDFVIQEEASETKNNARTINDNARLDTVGAVCVDSSGTVSAAVSSGGLLLKFPGRIGQAAVFGSGCWAQNSSDRDKPSIACSVSGVGEYLMKTLFARECYQAMYDKHDVISALPDVFKERFLESPYLKNAPSKLAGVLTVKHYASDNVCELAWAHNTRTMILGFGSTSKEKTVSIVSQQPQGSKVGSSIVGGEKCFRLKKCR